MKILVLDDDAALLKALKNILVMNDHDVDCCDNAKEAIGKVAVNEYDFILVDYKMPENDGIWFMENAEIPKKTTVLLSTAFANREVINRMFDLGASGYLIKPYDEDELIRNLEFYSK